MPEEIKKVMYIGESSFVRWNRPYYAVLSPYWKDTYHLYVNPDATGWVCNVHKDNIAIL